MGRGLYFPFGVSLALVVIALLFGNKETSVQILGEYFTIRPLRLAVLFLIIDTIVFVLMWAVGMIRF